MIKGRGISHALTEVSFTWRMPHLNIPITLWEQLGEHWPSVRGVCCLYCKLVRTESNVKSLCRQMTTRILTPWAPQDCWRSYLPAPWSSLKVSFHLFFHRCVFNLNSANQSTDLPEWMCAKLYREKNVTQVIYNFIKYNACNVKLAKMYRAPWIMSSSINVWASTFHRDPLQSWNEITWTDSDPKLPFLLWWRFGVFVDSHCSCWFLHQTWINWFPPGWKGGRHWGRILTHALFTAENLNIQC